MKRGGIAAALAVALSGPAWAADEKPDRPHPSIVNWVSRASADDLRAAYQKAGMTVGRGAILCKVQDDGALSACQVSAASPGAEPFAHALLDLAAKYRRRPPGPQDLREVLVVETRSPIDEAADWVKQPSPEDLRAVFPVAALRVGAKGSAVVNCLVTIQGALDDCVAVEEEPAGLGFGDAGRTLMTQVSMKPARLRGEPAPSYVSIPVRWTEPPPSSGATIRKRIVSIQRVWASAPSFADLAAAYPPKAKAADLLGRAVVGCEVTLEGRMIRCRVLSEAPKGQGFGAAARRLAWQLRFPLATEADRQATRNTSIHFPVLFDPGLAKADPPAVPRPKWTSQPDPVSVRQAFMDRGASIGDKATLVCNVAAGGELSDCAVEGAQRAGEAAMSLASAFRLTTWTAEGLPTIGGRVRIPLRYEAEAPVAAAK